jgi:hypothetical protein
MAADRAAPETFREALRVLARGRYEFGTGRRRSSDAGKPDRFSGSGVVATSASICGPTEPRPRSSLSSRPSSDHAEESGYGSPSIPAATGVRISGADADHWSDDVGSCVSAEFMMRASGRICLPSAAEDSRNEPFGDIPADIIPSGEMLAQPWSSSPKSSNNDASLR